MSRPDNGCSLLDLFSYSVGKKIKHLEYMDSHFICFCALFFQIQELLCLDKRNFIKKNGKKIDKPV